MLSVGSAVARTALSASTRASTSEPLNRFSGPWGAWSVKGWFVEELDVHDSPLGQVGNDHPDEVDLGAGVGPVIQEPRECLRRRVTLDRKSVV